MAALTIYIDDSGTDPNQAVAVAAGWISPIEQWKKFAKGWERLKHAPGYEFGCFHMSPCLARNEDTEFRDWDSKKQQLVIRSIRKLVRKRALQGFAVAVGKDDYDDTITGDLRKEAGDNHYTWAFRGLVGLIERWRIANSITGSIEFIFDHIERHELRRKEIEVVFDRAGVEEPIFKKSCELSPLQAADVLAFCTYQKALSKLFGKPMHPIAEESFNEFAAYDGQRWLEATITNRRALAQWVIDVSQKRGTDPWLPLLPPKNIRKAP